jgi:hypothetical protein
VIFGRLSRRRSLALEAARGFDTDLAKARHSKGVILSEPGFAEAKEDGETVLGLDGEKVLSPEMNGEGIREVKGRIREQQMQQ